jgi:NTP pyrophosphatase (non-canonical NTP hydrolase)
MTDNLELAVVEWAHDKGIFDNSDPIAQISKMKEEVEELDEELTFIDKSLIRIEGELGDVLVTVIIQAHFHGLSLADCLQQAHDKISKRKGKLVDGVFVKEG